MAPGAAPANKRTLRLQRQSQIFQLPSPPFVRLPRASRTLGSPPGLTLSPTHQHERSYHFPSVSVPSPSSPLLPTTSTTALANFPVPPTANDLAAGDKAMLMRKMRKLGRVLGELPVPEISGEDALERRLSVVIEGEHRSSSTLSRIASISKSTVSKTARKVFSKSLTLGYTSNSVMEADDMRRVKSSVRPSLNIPSPMQCSAAVYPNNSIRFARSVDGKPSLTLIQSTPSSPHPDTPYHPPVPKFPQRRDSTASSVLLADQDQEQVQRTRAAKLPRHLGGNVPPEVLHPSQSPLPQVPSASSSILGHTVVDHSEMPGRNSSLSAHTSSPRLSRCPLSQSVEFRTFKGVGTTSAPSTPPHSITTVSERAKTVSGLRRVRSLWIKGSNENDDAATDDNSSRARIKERSSCEKERVSNVKRARKMAQVNTRDFP